MTNAIESKPGSAGARIVLNGANKRESPSEVYSIVVILQV